MNRWEYMQAEFGLTKAGWTLIAVNDQPNQQQGVTTYQFLSSVGNQGWELVNSEMTLGVQGRKWLSIKELLSGDTEDTVSRLWLLLKRPQA